MASVLSPALCKPAHVVDKETKRIELGPGEGHAHTASVLLLHGFGDNASGWYTAALWWTERLPGLKIIIPTAPYDPHQGCHSWFPLGGSAATMADGVASAVAGLAKEVEAQVSAVGGQRVVVAGFSQGGALAYHLGLNAAGASEGSEARLGGLVALSTFLRPQLVAPHAISAPATIEVTGAVMSTPVLICHGDADDRIPGGAAGAEQAAEMLMSAGMTDVSLKIYTGMHHSVSEQELVDVLDFLRRIVELPDGPVARL